MSNPLETLQLEPKSIRPLTFDIIWCQWQQFRHDVSVTGEERTPNTIFAHIGERLLYGFRFLEFEKVDLEIADDEGNVQFPLTVGRARLGEAYLAELTDTMPPADDGTVVPNVNVQMLDAALRTARYGTTFGLVHIAFAPVGYSVNQSLGSAGRTVHLGLHGITDVSDASNTLRFDPPLPVYTEVAS